MQKKQYAVQINNQKEFDELIEYYDRVGWKWQNNDKPKHNAEWKKHSPCISLQDRFGQCTRDYFENFCNYTIITLSQAKEKIRHMKAYKEWSGKQIKLPKAKDPKAKKITIKSSKQWLKDFINENKDEIKAYKEWRERQAQTKIQPHMVYVDKKIPKHEANPNPAVFSNNPTKEVTISINQDGIDGNKIKIGDDILVLAKVINTSKYKGKINIEAEYDPDKYSISPSLNQIKKHIPVKSALEVAEEKLKNIENEMMRIEGADYLEPYFDEYYQARKKVETLKGKN